MLLSELPIDFIRVIYPALLVVIEVDDVAFFHNQILRRTRNFNWDSAEYCQLGMWPYQHGNVMTL
jgi:predicted RND superfamily exporter protein